MHDENLQVSAVQYSPELREIFNSIKIYQNKLVNVKKDMKLLHEKSTKLKVRFFHYVNINILQLCFRNVP